MIVYDSELRHRMLQCALRLEQLGLNRGSSGNVGARSARGLMVTPSGVPAQELRAEDMVELDFNGAVLSSGKPSSEWRFHRDILAARPEINAVIHTHAMYATTLACLRRDIPPFHYMIAAAGGDTIRCAPYALFGTQELSDHALHALQGRMACLLANHGMIALGDGLHAAEALALEVETLCQQYWSALQVGQPHILTGQQMQQVIERFKTYGRRKDG